MIRRHPNPPRCVRLALLMLMRPVKDIVRRRRPSSRPKAPGRRLTEGRNSSVSRASSHTLLVDCPRHSPHTCIMPEHRPLCSRGRDPLRRTPGSCCEPQVTTPPLAYPVSGNTKSPGPAIADWDRVVPQRGDRRRRVRSNQGAGAAGTSEAEACNGARSRRQTTCRRLDRRQGPLSHYQLRANMSTIDSWAPRRRNDSARRLSETPPSSPPENSVAGSRFRRLEIHSRSTERREPARPGGFSFP